MAWESTVETCCHFLWGTMPGAIFCPEVRRSLASKCLTFPKAPKPEYSALVSNCQALIEMGQSIEEDRRALEAEGAVKIRKIEVDFEHFEVRAYVRYVSLGLAFSRLESRLECMLLSRIRLLSSRKLSAQQYY